MFVWFASEGTKSVHTKEVAPGILLDFDAAGNVIGLEVLDVRERVAGPRAKAALASVGGIPIVLSDCQKRPPCTIRDVCNSRCN